ncbi:DUF2520 domain-containing protein [Micrococcales bacterium 31B]|nr:DUF2520 domain-containing protein [Micrococcales bacterium 31B]
MTHGHERDGRLGIGVIGAGRVGPVLASVFRSVGHAVIGIHARSAPSRERVEDLVPGVPCISIEDIVERSELVVLAVPDDELEPLVRRLAAEQRWHAGQLVAHVSGRYGVGVLAAAQEQGAIPLALHPAMTFSGTHLDVARLQGCPFGVTAPAIALPIVQALAIELGGEPVVIAEGDRSLYHAALSHGANHLVTLVAQARDALRAMGVDQPGTLLGPLLHAALDAALAEGDQALTGPVRRGDVGTVRAHLAALSHLGDAPGSETPLAEVAGTYAALMGATARRCAAAGFISDARAAELTHLAAPAASGNHGEATQTDD